MQFQVRQGDVLVRQVAEIPGTAERLARDKGRVVLAYGEVTGHAHALHGPRVVMFRDDGLARAFIEVTGDAPEKLTHEEHGTIEIPPGKFEVVIQREYRPEGIRNVAD